MITSVRFCLSNDLLNVILLPSKFVYFNENLHCCKGCLHDVTCFPQKWYVMCGHNIIYDMMLSTQYMGHKITWIGFLSILSISLPTRKSGIRRDKYLSAAIFKKAVHSDDP